MATRAPDKKYLYKTSPPEPLVQIQNNFSELFLITPSRLKYGIGADLSFFFHVISILQKNCVIKEHFIRVMQKGIVRSCLSENFKLLTLPALKIWSIMCSQNGHL